jgi:putative flippase GtrA
MKPKPQCNSRYNRNLQAHAGPADNAHWFSGRDSIECMDRLKQVFWHKSDNALAQLLRYAVVAGIGLVVDFGGLIILKEYAHLNYIVAATISFTVALVINYYLSMWWVFPPSRHSRWREFVMFGAIGLVGLVLNDLIIWALTSGFGVYYVWSKAISTAIVFSWNFFARKAFFAAKPRSTASSN